MKNSSVDTDLWVEKAALELVHLHSLDEIEESLVNSGVPAPTALKLVMLIPSAFAREHFEPQGIKFPEHFFVGSNGQFSERPYSSEPIYSQARSLARRWLGESRPSLILRVLDWSAEANSIKEANERGFTPSEVSAVHHGF